MPTQLIKCLPLGIFFPLNDFPVLTLSDRALFFESDFRPLLLRDDGPRQPIHVQGEVVESAQIDVGGNSSYFEDLKENFGLRLDDYFLANKIKGLFFSRPNPARLR